MVVQWLVAFWSFHRRISTRPSTLPPCEFAQLVWFTSLSVIIYIGPSTLLPKQKQHPVVNGTGDGSRVRCCKEQYCIGTWNVRSMNQGKLQVVKQEVTRVNIDILGINELRWTGMGEFNSDDHYIYYCGQESLRRNGVAIIINKRVQNVQYLDAISTTTEWSRFISKANHSISW